MPGNFLIMFGISSSITNENSYTTFISLLLINDIDKLPLLFLTGIHLLVYQNGRLSISWRKSYGHQFCVFVFQNKHTFD